MTNECIICKNEYEGYGNNALPIIAGKCCDDCNERLVVPFRINCHYAFEQNKKDVLKAYGIKEIFEDLDAAINSSLIKNLCKTFIERYNIIKERYKENNI